MTRRESPSPPPPPPSSFPTPFARQRSTDPRQNAAGTSTYLQAGPPPGDNYVPMTSPNTRTSQLYASTQPPPSQPPPIPRSTRPHPSVTVPTHAPAHTPTFTSRPTPSHEYAQRRPLAPQMSGHVSNYSSISDPGQSTQARPPFTDIGPHPSGSRPPQRLMTMPQPVLPHNATSMPYQSGSSPPNYAYPPRAPQSVMSGEPPPPPPPNQQGWSYLDTQESLTDNLSSDSGDDDFPQSPDSVSSPSGYMGQKGPASTPFGRSRRPKRRESAPASSSSQVLSGRELERCKLCPTLGPRHEWASLGHSGFCSERHKWQWDETYSRR